MQQGQSTVSASRPGTGWQRFAPLIAVLMVLVSLGARATIEQQRAYDRGVSLEEQALAGDARWTDVIVEYRWAMRWYTPWGSHHGAAADALLRIAALRADDHPEDAVMALDGLRSALIAARSFYQPRPDLIAQVHAQIPTLLARVAERNGDKRPRAELEARFRRDYERPVGVPLHVSAAVTLGFLLWFGAAIWTVARGLEPDGRFGPRAWRGIGASALGFAMWAAAMFFG
jgi:hypothetical protein